VARQITNLAEPTVRGAVVSFALVNALLFAGDWELHARYSMQTDDGDHSHRCGFDCMLTHCFLCAGYLIAVKNTVLMHLEESGTKYYQKLVCDFEAPLNSPYAHLHHAIFIGQLGPDYDGFVNVNVWRLL
jgi:hypothetical protein